jgi:hypothetical protein
MVKIWRIKVNKTKSIHVTITLKRENCPQFTLNGKQIPQEEIAKYLGIHLDRLSKHTYFLNENSWG